MDFQATEDDPLQAALATAFTDSPIVASRPTLSPSQPPGPEAAQEQQAEAGGGDESWKDEYEQHLSHWRAESAVAREKAEQERERWRHIREQEQAELERRRDAHVGGSRRKDSEWETVTASFNVQGIAETAPKDAREGGHGPFAAKQAAAVVHETPPHYGSPSPADLVTGEISRDHADPMETPATVTAPQSTTDYHGLSSSRTWEEVPSVESSFPSLSFPDRSVVASPDPRERPLYQQPPAAPSVTLAIFDSSLSRRARILALISSLAINMFLPFVNGVMLGFGEIFAKHVVVGFLGWNIPSTAVGVRAAPRRY